MGSQPVIEYQNGDAPLLRAVLERPDNGKQIIAVELDAGRKVIALIGDTSGKIAVGSMASDGGAQLQSFAGDYQLDLKFQAEPGLRLAYDPDLFDPRHDMDIDGDERMDIPMIIEDDNANNEPVGVIVRGGDNFDVLWPFPFPAEHKENILKGFFDRPSKPLLTIQTTNSSLQNVMAKSLACFNLCISLT